ncbi:MAG TPA: HAD family acid phosphatase [Baekduia sp.]|nr:HAD family acid phosphatase [Baekduia sp.]
MLRHAVLAGLVGATICGVAVAADGGSPAVDYPSAGGATLTSVRPTGVGLPQVGATGTVGAGELPGALRSYHDGGAYAKDLASVGTAAQAYLDARLDDQGDAAASAPPSSGSGTPTAGGGTAGATGTATTPPSATKGCTTKYMRIKRPKGKAALYRRVRTCPTAKAKIKAKRAAVVKPAIVLDIDETSLSNYDGLAATNFSSIGTAIPAATGTGTAIAPTLALYKDARAHGVAVFFITGRPSAIAGPTADNLKNVGYDQGWDGLQFKPADQTTMAFKSSARAAIEAKGYDIVLNLGDQESDLDGGHQDRAFKLPNPYYFIAD